MSFLNWFSGKSGASNEPRNQPAATGDKSPSGRVAPDASPAARQETRKAKRHSRRDQLFVAVREAMTRSGVLASSYKFKVLSLDRRGDQFLIMTDVEPALGKQPEKLIEIEAAITQTARVLFEIQVTAVYFRTETTAITGIVKPAGTAAIRPQITQAEAVAASLRTPPAGSGRREPIQEDEVMAFRRALAAGQAKPETAFSKSDAKNRAAAHSYTLLTGFEDTEMRESSAVPALSRSQYGDLT
jgi:hypothetical protein